MSWSYEIERQPYSLEGVIIPPILLFPKFYNIPDIIIPPKPCQQEAACNPIPTVRQPKIEPPREAFGSSLADSSPDGSEGALNTLCSPQHHPATRAHHRLPPGARTKGHSSRDARDGHQSPQSWRWVNPAAPGEWESPGRCPFRSFAAFDHETDADCIKRQQSLQALHSFPF